LKSLLENLVSEQKQVITQEEQRLDVLDGELQQLRCEFESADKDFESRFRQLTEYHDVKNKESAEFQKAVHQDFLNAHEYTKSVSDDLEKLAAGELGVTRDLLNFTGAQIEINRINYIQHITHWVAWGGLVVAFILHCLGVL
jgi:hypothetical protein